MKHSLLSKITFILVAFSGMVGATLTGITTSNEEKVISKIDGGSDSYSLGSSLNKSLHHRSGEFSDTFPVTIDAGTGVSVFLSTDPNATSGDPSGTYYYQGTTVYAFVDLKPGYKPVIGWIHISDSIYRLPTSREITEAYNFGTHGSAGKYTYNIVYNLDGGSLEEENLTTYNVETPTLTLNNPTKDGYTFLGWTGSNGDAPETSVTIDLGSIGDRTYNANYAYTEYNISYELNGGTVTGENPNKYSFSSPDFTLTNPTRDGCIFKGWSGTGLVGDENLSVTINHTDTGDKTFTANWTLIDYSITYDLNGGTLETANPSTYNVETATFTLHNPTKTGYTFLGWSGTDITDKSTSVTIEQGSVGDKSYTANWSANNYKVTLNRGGADSGTPYVNVDYGSEMPNIQIPSLPHKTFIGYWDGNDISICTQYYDADGHSTHVWDKAKNSTIYAHYIPSLEFLSITDTTHTYDGEGHSYGALTLKYYEGSVQISLYDNDYDILFSDDEGLTYTLDKEHGATFSEPGEHKVYYQATKDGYGTLKGTFNITIVKDDATYVSEPSAKDDLKYTGSPQELINIGTANGGTLKYSLDGVNYSENVPTGTDAGEYSVYYKIFGDDYHNDTEVETLYVSITKAQAVLTPPTAKEGLKYTGEALELVNAGSTTFGEVLYKLDNGEYSTSVPKATNVGSYKVYFKVLGNDNFDGVEESSVIVSISENDKSTLLNKIDEAETYLNSIKDKYSFVSDELQDVINTAIAVNNNKNVTIEEINQAIQDLNNALNKAKEDVALIENVVKLINDIGEVSFPASKDAIDLARTAYNALDKDLQALVENYATLTSAEATYANLASKRNDDASGVYIETKDGTPIAENINLKVEIRTSVKAEEGSSEYSNIQNKLASDEVISNVYDIKLTKNEGGVETIIQPSDIKEGMKIIVYIKVPTGLEVSNLKILHIHSENDISFVENFEIKNGEIVFEVDRFSEIAFVKKVNDSKPVDPSAKSKLPNWVIVLIAVGGLLIVLSIFFIIFATVKKGKKEKNL